ncbi:MAG: hypothetical protein HYV15_00515, partial [Elusimicrobia bacterium]|nr:hypothetical protein [Elusimicrobiota bacterium]
PGRLPRLVLAGLTAMVLFFPGRDFGFFTVLSASAVVVPAFLISKPKSILAMDPPEAFFFWGTLAAVFIALFSVGSENPAEAWRGTATLAALAVLQAQRAREVIALRWAEVLPGVKPPPALDLSRYELKVGHKAPEQRAALPKGVEAQLVDSGSFRVDVAKMLGKLRDYQLSDPLDFLCAWLRCGAASGAKSIGLRTGWTSLELRFDGRAFAAAELSHPYQALVDGEGPDARRGCHFAYGLLALYRLSPRRVTVTSRGEGGVAVMNAGVGEPADPETAPEGTVIRVDWPFWGVFWQSFFAAVRARDRFGLGPATLTIDGKRMPYCPTSRSWTRFADRGWRFAAKARDSGSRVRVYVLGTFIEELGDETLAGVDAWIGHDELELNISQSSVIRGGLLDEGLRLLASRAE